MGNEKQADYVRKIVQVSAELLAELSSQPPTLAGRNLEYAIERMMDALDEWRQER